jgi:hypothetical protein
MNEDIKLKGVRSLNPRSMCNNMCAYWDDLHGSQEDLAKTAGYIIARTPNHQEVNHDIDKHRA